MELLVFVAPSHYGQLGPIGDSDSDKRHRPGVDSMEVIDIGSASDDDSSDSNNSDHDGEATEKYTIQLTKWYANTALRYPPWLSTVCIILFIVLFIATAYVRLWTGPGDTGDTGGEQIDHIDCSNCFDGGNSDNSTNMDDYAYV